MLVLLTAGLPPDQLIGDIHASMTRHFITSTKFILHLSLTLKL